MPRQSRCDVQLQKCNRAHAIRAKQMAEMKKNIDKYRAELIKERTPLTLNRASTYCNFVKNVYTNQTVRQCISYIAPGISMTLSEALPTPIKYAAAGLTAAKFAQTGYKMVYPQRQIDPFQNDNRLTKIKRSTLGRLS